MQAFSTRPWALAGLTPWSYTVNLVPMRLDLESREKATTMICIFLPYKHKLGEVWDSLSAHSPKVKGSSSLSQRSSLKTRKGLRLSINFIFLDDIDQLIVKPTWIVLKLQESNYQKSRTGYKAALT